LHTVVISGSFFVGDLIMFTTGLLLAVLLLSLTLRALKLPGSPVTNLVFALCAFLWTAGGLTNVALVVAGFSRRSPVVLAAQAIQLFGAAAFPIPILAIWRSFATQPWQKIATRVLLICASLSAATLGYLSWVATAAEDGRLQLSALNRATAYSAGLLLLAGAVVSLRRRVTPRPIYLASGAIVAAVCGASLIGDALEFLRGHLILLVVICSFFLFARFRFADIFIRHGVRILLAGLGAATLAFFAQSPLLVHIASHSKAPPAVHVFGVMLVANALLLSFTFVDDRLSKAVNRWLFRTPDYRAEIRDLSTRLRALPAESEIARAVEDAARRPLELSGARLVTVGEFAAWPAAIFEDEIVELAHTDPMRAALPLPGAEALIPVSVSGQVSHVLLVAPGVARPGLVTNDVNYLRAVAVQCGHRLDALRREQEAIERQSREALLLQQVTEAELLALRAQVNPHFLFNSLNTIADLIVRDPPRAEAMTLRLAGVFRHVLAHSSRALTSLRDEIELLRTYLYIEEVRFGDRLKVEFEIAPEVAGEMIPSLILQPLVENALKHGLAPKPGPGRLWIYARAQEQHVCILIEDDGMGLRSGFRETPGHGLTNVAERLRTLYDDRASVMLEPRDGSGTRVTVLLPRREMPA
jgi:two-component system LytT family sensor kinase